MKVPDSTSTEEKDREMLKKILRSKYNHALELGIDSIEKLAMYVPIKLVELGLYSDYESAARAVREARRYVGADLVITRDKRRRYLELPKLTTGVRAIDNLLDGGLWPGKLYGIYGEEGAGKSRIAHQLAVTIQLPPINGKAVYMDSENVFKEDIIVLTAERFELDPDQTLENILVVDSTDYFNLEEFLRKVWPDYLQHGYNLLIIDTLVGPYREAFPGRGYLAERQQRINSVINWIRSRIRYFNAFCLITNQVQAVPDPSKGIDKTYVGGYVLGHGITEWYVLYKAGGSTRRIIAYDVIHKKTGESAQFKITDYGLEDVETQ
jgi:DNA repair protein RadA